MAVDTYSERLAEFLSELECSKIPQNAVSSAKSYFLDWLGCAYTGSAKEDMKLTIIDYAKNCCNGKSSIIAPVHHKTISPMAAFANGCTSHRLDFDDYHAGGSVHPSVTVMSAAFALAEELSSTGKDFITAVVAGYEVCIRVARILLPSYYFFHSTGTAGTFGSAAACGKLLDLNISQFVNTLGNAGTMAAGIWQFLEDGALSKVIHAGNAAKNGLVSAKLSEKGMTGAKRIFEGEKGICRAFNRVDQVSDCNLELLIDNLGIKYKISEVSIKPYPSCAGTHAAIDATSHIVKENNVDVSSISKVEVEVPKRMYDLGLWNKRPRNAYSAKFSIPFCVSAVLKFRKIGIAEFNTENIKKLVNIMNRVEVVHSPELDIEAIEAGSYPSIVRMTLKDGTTLERKVTYPKGHEKNPMTEEDIQRKFEQSVKGIIPEGIIRQIISSSKKLERFEDLSIFLGGK